MSVERSPYYFPTPHGNVDFLYAFCAAGFAFIASPILNSLGVHNILDGYKGNVDLKQKKV